MDRDTFFPIKFISYEKAPYNDNRDAVISYESCVSMTNDKMKREPGLMWQKNSLKVTMDFRVCFKHDKTANFAKDFAKCVQG